jgi:predicted amidophosphoribosyltransferase
VTSALLCPSCGTPHGSDERFCPDCGLPLVHSPDVAAAAPPVTAAQERARKVRAGYAQGPLVRVAAARNQAEAELLQGLLLEEGIPSLVRRSGGFDVPDFLAAGPRDVLVPQSGEQAARDLLRTTAPRPRVSGHQTARPWVRALAAALAALIIATVAAGVIVAIAP